MRETGVTRQPSVPHRDVAKQEGNGCGHSSQERVATNQPGISALSQRNRPRVSCAQWTLFDNEVGCSVGRDGISFTVCAGDVWEDVAWGTFPTVNAPIFESLERFSVKPVS